MKQQNHFEIADLDLMCLKMTLISLRFKTIKISQNVSMRKSQFKIKRSKLKLLSVILFAFELIRAFFLFLRNEKLTLVMGKCFFCNYTRYKRKDAK